MSFFKTKKSLLSLAIVIATGSFLFFLTSATTTEQSNSEAIDALYEQIAELKQANEAPEAWGEGNIGEIRMFAGNFAPRGYALCDGQLLSISSNEALFSILGTMYGGDGRTNFALPDLRGRMPMHTDGGNKYPLGRVGRIKSKIPTHGAEQHDDEIFTLGNNGYQTVNFVIATTGLFPSRN